MLIQVLLCFVDSFPLASPFHCNGANSGTASSIEITFYYVGRIDVLLATILLCELCSLDEDNAKMD